jgi:hypothetical protein
VIFAAEPAMYRGSGLPDLRTADDPKVLAGVVKFKT